MNKKDIILYASIAGGAYLVYWYVTNYGPMGAVSAGAMSYWDSWFGQSAATLLPVNQGTMPTGPSQQVTPPVTSTTANPVNDLRSRLLAAASAGASTMMNADQWNYYRNNIAPPALTPAQFGAAFPNMTADRGPNMTVDQFLSAINAAGLVGNAGMMGIGMGRGIGDVIPVPSRPSVPMMSFGGALNPAFPSKKGWA